MLNCRSKSLVKSLLMVGCSVFLLSSSILVRLKNLISSSSLHGHGHDLHAIIPVFVGANGHPKKKNQASTLDRCTMDFAPSVPLAVWKEECRVFGGFYELGSMWVESVCNISEWLLEEQNAHAIECISLVLQLLEPLWMLCWWANAYAILRIYI
jgi:hypothetical protein